MGGYSAFHMRFSRRLAVLASFAVCAPVIFASVHAASPDLRYRIWTREDGLPQGSVRGIAQTSDGYLWIATLDGLVRFDGVRMVVFARPEVPEMTSNRCLTMLVDGRGVLWVGLDDGTIVRISGPHITAFGPKEGVRFSTYDGLSRDNDGRVWATVVSGGAAMFDGARWTPSPARPAIVAPALPAGVHIPSMPLAPGAVRSTPVWMTTPTGRIWAFADGFLHRYDAGSWTTFPTRVPSALMPVTSLFEDREGTLWIASEGGGLGQASPAVVRGIVPPGPEQYNVDTVSEDDAGRLWIGTRGGPLLFEHDSFVMLSAQPWWPRLSVTMMKPDVDGSMLVGGLSGLYRVWPYRRFEQLLASPITHVFDFLRDRQNVVWVATGTGLLRSTAATWTKVTGLPFDARVLRESRDGTVWVGGYGGLARVAGNGDPVRVWTVADGLSSDRIRALHEDEHGALWIGTFDGGLMRFADGKFVSILKRDGLFDNGAFTIIDGGDGRYYMCSNRGIYSVAIRELEAFASGAARSVTSRAYRSVDGMPSSECNGGTQPSGWRRVDGSLWFPTQGGLAVLDPHAVTENAVPPTVVVEAVTTEHRSIPVDNPIDLAPGERRLEVQYTANTFIRPEAIRFRHQLVNFDRDWVEAGSQRFVQYSYIPPGEYTLKILAANSDGVWSPAVSLPIRVRPYWWQTMWVRAAAVLLGLTLLWAAYQRRVSALNRRRAEQDAFARRLLESQEAERKRIAYELHDGIGQTLVVIKNRALLGMDAGGDPALVTHLTEISTAAGSAIDEVRKVAYGLRPYQLDRLGVTRALQSLVEQSAAASGLTLTADIDELDGLLTKNDEVNVYRIVQEAVSNTVRHARARNGRVTVGVSQHAIDIRIQDDGAGFDPVGQDGGLGLAGMAERARILGGHMTVRSSPGQGTTIQVVLLRPNG